MSDNLACGWQVLREPPEYDPRGPDGRGRNRLRIEFFGSVEAKQLCRLRPRNAKALWEALERDGRYADLDSCDGCGTGRCPRSCRDRGAPFHGELYRVDEDGGAWMMNRRDRGWAELGVFVSWSDAAERLRRSPTGIRWCADKHGELVEVL